MTRAVADNDVLYKGAWFNLLRELIEQIPSAPKETLILGAAKFVVGKRLEKQLKKGVPNAEHALKQFTSILEEIVAAEPSADELALAAELEALAVEAGLALDSGESQLCAVVLCRDLKFLATGDKRAIASLEALARARSDVAALAGRVICLEQLFVRLLAVADPASIRRQVCANVHADRALAMCFSCTSAEVPPTQWAAGLHSYVEAARADAPTMLSGTIAQEDGVG